MRAQGKEMPVEVRGTELTRSDGFSWEKCALNMRRVALANRVTSRYFSEHNLPTLNQIDCHLLDPTEFWFDTFSLTARSFLPRITTYGTEK